MARIRTIKPAAFSSESLAAVSVHARWTFAGLWTYVDDAGRGRANPKLIKAHVWPLDEDVTVSDVEKLLAELEREGMIRRYTVGGQWLLAVVNWQHQRINRPTESIFPAPPITPQGALIEHAVSPPEPSITPQAPSLTEHEGSHPRARAREGKGRERKEQLLAAEPRQERPPDLIWDALLGACGIDAGSLTTPQRGATNKAAAELRGVHATPDDIKARAHAYRRTFPNAALTPSALVKHWASLNGTPPDTSTPPYYERLR